MEVGNVAQLAHRRAEEPLPSRVAEFESSCPGCGWLIEAGERIVLGPDGLWVHEEGCVG